MGNPAPTRARKIAIVGSSAVGKYIYHHHYTIYTFYKSFIQSTQNVYIIQSKYFK